MSFILEITSIAKQNQIDINARCILSFLAKNHMFIVMNN